MPSKRAEAESQRLRDVYARMAAHHGVTHWWPGETRFEVVIGAILTQNTAWINVKKALENLKRAELMSPEAMVSCELGLLEGALRPSGYFRQKAKRVRLFCEHLIAHYQGDIVLMAKRPLKGLRHELLALHGIGPETADDIILYACDLPVFVVDAYTRRIFSRHGIVPENIGYEHLRAYFEDRLEHDVTLFKEYHGLIVWTAKEFCRTNPNCEGCPLQPLLKRGQPLHVQPRISGK